VVQHQRPGVVEQDLLRHAAERPECALQPLEPAGLALVPKRAHVQATRVAERSDEQVSPDHLPADHHPLLAEVDLHLPAGRRLEPDRRPRLGRELPAQWCHRALDRAQAHRDPVLGQQFLPHHVGVAAMPPEPFRQPVREPVQRLRPLRPAAARPAVQPEVAPDRVPAAAELGRDPLRAPSQPAQSQHRRHLVRRQHLLPPQISDLRSSLAATSAHRPLLVRRGSVLHVVRGSVCPVARHPLRGFFFAWGKPCPR